MTRPELVLRVLGETHLLLEDAERWTRRVPARDAAGRAVMPWDSRAVRWCLIGALRHGCLAAALETGLRPRDLLHLCLNALQVDGAEATRINDVQGHEDVMLLLRFAILRMETSEEGAPPTHRSPRTMRLADPGHAETFHGV